MRNEAKRHAKRDFGARLKTVVLVLAALLLLGGGASAVAQDASPLDEWSWQNPLPQGNDLHCAVYADGRYVTIGERVVMASSDGRQWERRGDLELVQCMSLVHAEGLYVASEFHTEMTLDLHVSEDGETWQHISIGEGVPRGIRALTQGDGTFVGVAGPMVLTSRDGRAWTTERLATSTQLVGVAHGDDRFVAVGGKAPPGAGELSGAAVLVSSDAESWNEVNTDIDTYLANVAYGAGVFLAVGPGGTIVRSTDGEQWQQVRSPTDADLHRVVYRGDRFIVLAAEGALLTSADGLQWRRVTGVGDLADIAHGDAGYVGVGGSGRLAVSEDARRWREVSSTVSGATYFGLAAEGKRVVGVGSFGAIVTSPDSGSTWRARHSGTREHLHGIVRAGRLFVAVGTRGSILTSPNGIGWAQRRSGTSQDLHAVTFGRNLYVAVGANGRIITSPDGRRWTTRESGTAAHLNGVTFANGRFVAVGGGSESYGQGVVLTSRDGIRWTPSAIDWPEGTIYDVAYGNGVFVAIGVRYIEDGTTAVSPDGVNWTYEGFGSHAAFKESTVTFSHGAFLALNPSHFDVALSWPSILSSNDGLSWTPHRHPSAQDLYAAALVQGRFVVAGVGGAILRSAPYLAARPAFSVRGGTYRQAQHVTLTTRTEGAIIRYTTDGRLPSCTRGTEITSGGFVTLERDAVLQAVACAEGYGMSELRKETYRFRGR